MAKTTKGRSKAYLRKAAEDEFDYTCEWLSCSETFSTLNELNHHVDRHRRGYTRCNALQNVNMEYLFYCQWQDCGAQIEGTLEVFTRHLFYHTFHQYLKQLGGYIQKVEKLTPCTLGVTSRNMTPELPENLICLWQGCNTSFDNPYIFYAHVTYHCEEMPKGNFPNQPIKCQWEGCTTSLKTRYKLQDHTRSHTQAKVVACPTCGALFSNNTKFIDHLKRQAGGKGKENLPE